jgi:hypothetical protein
LLAQADHAAASDGSGGSLQSVCDQRYSDRVPVVDGNTEVGKIDRNARHKALDELTDASQRDSTIWRPP